MRMGAVSVTREQETALTAHLRKCELQWIADNVPGGECVGWLEPYCDSVKDILELVRGLGFRVRRIVDDVGCAGEKMQWVETTSRVIVYVNDGLSRGLVARAWR